MFGNSDQFHTLQTSIKMLEQARITLLRKDIGKVVRVRRPASKAALKRDIIENNRWYAYINQFRIVDVVIGHNGIAIYVVLPLVYDYGGKPVKHFLDNVGLEEVPVKEIAKKVISTKQLTALVIEMTNVKYAKKALDFLSDDYMKRPPTKEELDEYADFVETEEMLARSSARRNK